MSGANEAHEEEGSKNGVQLPEKRIRGEVKETAHWDRAGLPGPCTPLNAADVANIVEKV